MKYIFILASFNAFFFLVLLLQKKPKLLHDHILVFWLLYLGFATAFYTFTMGFFPDDPFLSSGIIALFLLHGPFLYLYVSAFMLEPTRLKAKDLLHFMPFFAFILYLLIASGFPAYSAGIRVDHVTEGAVEPPVLFLFFLSITALSGPVYFVMAHRQFNRIKRSSHDYTSKDSDLDWLGKLIKIFGIIWTALIVIAVIHHLFHLFSMIFCINGLYLSLSVFIILIGYFGLKQKYVFINFPIGISEKSNPERKMRYAGSRLGEEESQKCFSRMQDYMKVKKPYLDPDLTLPKLAEDLEVPAHHLSQVINEMHGRNFFDLINQFRVEEVKRKIQDADFQNYSLFGIALESGFNSKSAFNRVFKSLSGTTPSQFRSSLKSS